METTQHNNNNTRLKRQKTEEKRQQKQIVFLFLFCCRHESQTGQYKVLLYAIDSSPNLHIIGNELVYPYVVDFKCKIMFNNQIKKNIAISMFLILFTLFSRFCANSIHFYVQNTISNYSINFHYNDFSLCTAQKRNRCMRLFDQKNDSKNID